MEVVAKARYIRMSPRKVRLVADAIRGLDIGAAESQLKFMRKAAARPVLKVVLSAKANAEHNFKLEGSGLYVKAITVDGGPVLKRWLPRAFGRATPLRKRSSHITVILDERISEGAPRDVLAKAVVKEKSADEKAVSKEEGESVAVPEKKDSKPSEKTGKEPIATKTKKEESEA